MNRDKVIKALQRDIRITERDPEMIRHVHSGRLCYFFEVKAVESAIALLQEQENASKRNPVIVCPHCGKRVK